MLAIVLVSSLSTPAAAQIISTMVPVESGSQDGTARTAVHGMFGGANWNFGNDADQQRLAQAGGNSTLVGGHLGFIGAGELVTRITPRLSAGGGGWFNRLSDQQLRFPDGVPSVLIFEPFDVRVSQSFYSVYGNVFFQHVGVQAGLVHLSDHRAMEFANSTNDLGDNSKMDIDVFGIGRFGGRRWSATVGAGVYRYSDSTFFEVVYGPGSSIASEGPATAPSVFANSSFWLSPHVSVDVSLWYTGKDSVYSDANPSANPSQNRFTIGVGVGR